MLEKLKSRKFLVAISAMVGSVVASQLGVPQWVIEGILKVAGYYLGAQGLVDMVGNIKFPKDEAKG